MWQQHSEESLLIKEQSMWKPGANDSRALLQTFHTCKAQPPVVVENGDLALGRRVDLHYTLVVLSESLWHWKAWEGSRGQAPTLERLGGGSFHAQRCRRWAAGWWSSVFRGSQALQAILQGLAGTHKGSHTKATDTAGDHGELHGIGVG